jgi:hypothetical protein
MKLVLEEIFQLPVDPVMADIVKPTKLKQKGILRRVGPDKRGHRGGNPADAL